jgi:hypothetical protein
MDKNKKIERCSKCEYFVKNYIKEENVTDCICSKNNRFLYTYDVVKNKEDIVDKRDCPLISKEDKIKFIMDNFDFKKVHKVFLTNGWNYADSKSDAITIEEIKNNALFLLNTVMKSKKQRAMADSGRLLAIKQDDNLMLFFHVISEYLSEY